MEYYKEIKPDIRYLKELKDVIFDKNWFKKADSNLELYYMYRGIKKLNKIRCDITVIPPLKLGKEFNRTLGHFHKGNFGEIYKVLEGKGLFYLQKNKNLKEVDEVKVIKAKKGDFIIIPAEFGHITINPENQTLIIANWISTECKSDYSIFKKMKGAAYFYTSKGWIRNKNYSKIPKINFEKPFKKLPKNWEEILKGK
jgi:glucose-6-phosphate isomerase